MDYVSLISLNKKFVKKGFSNEKRLFSKYSCNFQVSKLFKNNKKLQNLNEILNFTRKKNKLSLSLSSHKNFDKFFFQKNNEKIGFQEDFYPMINIRNSCSSRKLPLHSFDNKKYLPMSLYYTTKVDELSFIGKEKRYEIDELIRKEIMKINIIETDKCRNHNNPLIKERAENVLKNGRKDLKPFLTETNLNRKIILNANRILELLDNIFI